MSRDAVQRLVAVAAAAFGLAYYSAFLDYGLNFDDEGTLLYQFERMSEGEWPYVDFHVGYTLGVYYLHLSLIHI